MADRTSASDPSTSPVRTLSGAAVCVLLGMCLGFALLLGYAPKKYASVAARDADVADSTAFGTAVGERYYFKGAVGSRRAWQQPLAQFLQASPRSVEVTTAQLNAAIAALFGARRAAGEDRTEPLLEPGQPNFFVDPSVGVCCSVPVQFNLGGSKHKVLVYAQGRFTSDPPLKLQLTTLHINQAAVPLIAGLQARLWDWLLQAYLQPDVLDRCREAWQRVESVEIVADRLRFTLR